MAKIVNKTKVITGPRTRWSYANVWDPKSINGGTPKYSVSLIIPKSDKKTVEAIKAAIQAAYEEGESKLKGNGKTVPALSVIKTPLRDGDAERPDDPVYADAYFINANSATAPGIVDADLKPILERSEVYSGVYGRASRWAARAVPRMISPPRMTTIIFPETTQGGSHRCRPPIQRKCEVNGYDRAL